MHVLGRMRDPRSTDLLIRCLSGCPEIPDAILLALAEHSLSSEQVVAMLQEPVAPGGIGGTAPRGGTQ